MTKEGKCINYEYCRGEIEPDVGEDTCMGCGSWFAFGSGWDKLEFMDVNEECNICFSNVKRKVKFPTKCGHSFCIECTHELLEYDEYRYHINPMPYGCPPCLHANANNPSCKSRPCYDELDDPVVENWEKNDPAQSKKWRNAEIESVHKAEKEYEIRSNKCPMCRKKYERPEKERDPNKKVWTNMDN
jgi:hypothetical protein